MKLEIKNIHVYYNKVAAISDVSMEANKGDFVTLIGSNGAGKSTLLRTISGLEKPKQGEILLDGKKIHHLSPDKIVSQGIAQVPEGRRVFKELSVLENLYLGAFLSKNQSQIRTNIDKMFTIFPRLDERKEQMAGSMSGGEQQMLSIGRALMSQPKILLLDEPSLGLAPVIIQQIANTLIEINKQGVTIILVEQNAELALRIANYAYVLETGKVTMENQANKLLGNEHVKKAYLGL